MARNPHSRLSLGALVLGAMTLFPASALALQPLSEFLNGAKTANFDVREQAATVDQRAWEAEAALGRLLPSVSARGVLQYNQYEVAPQLPGAPKPIVITPKTQTDAFFQFDVPLIDLQGYYRYGQAKHLKRASELARESLDSQLTGTITRAYFLFVGASAMTEAAEQSLRSAEANLQFIQTRANYGIATKLDIARASANVERARQDIADAGLSRQLAARNLQTMTGIGPSPLESSIEVSLEAERPLGEWLANADTPADRVQRALKAAATSGRKAAQAAMLPTLSANAQERLTNAAGFSGHGSTYALQAVLSWRLDYGSYATARAQGAAESVQEVRTEKTRRASADAIFEAYHRVETGIAKSRSARAQTLAAHEAATFAEERYRAGSATQLDVTQAQRDAFVADVGRVQADTDLAYSRVQLRTLSAKPIGRDHHLWAKVASAPTTPQASPNNPPAAQPGTDSAPVESAAPATTQPTEIRLP